MTSDDPLIAPLIRYSHVLSAGLRTLAHLQLATREPTNVPKAIASLRRAHGIAKSNGCLRAACDDACNLYSTCLKYGGGVPREEALTGLRKAKDQAASLGYAHCHVELLLALGLGHLRTETRTWQADETELDLAETYLDKAIELVEPSSAMHVQALGHRCLCHLLRATAARFASVAEGRELPPHSETVSALRCASEALQILGSMSVPNSDGTRGPDATTLINMAIATLLAQRAAPDAPVDALAAATAARALLVAAQRCATEPEQRQKACVTMVGALEMSGDREGAISLVLELVAAAGAAGAPCRAAQLRLQEGYQHKEAGELHAALGSFKEALRLESAAA